ncbi:MAG: glycoside hydrolase family 65 [bacterium]|nr:glycoside hydrolase family 65 [bacterium]
MAINRKELVSRHNPILTQIRTQSPLSVGNGNFAYTADITGMQTLYGEYKQVLPLCTMAQWGWHTKPVSKERYAYALEDVEMTEYPWKDRKVYYAKEKKAGNEEVYDWVRQNPHKCNLARIALKKGKKEIEAGQISNIYQELHLYEGLLESCFCLDGVPCQVKTVCCGEEDTLAFWIESESLAEDLTVEFAFPYGSPDISASNWEAEEAHTSEIVEQTEEKVVWKRTLDRDIYYVTLFLEKARVEQEAKHRFSLVPTNPLKSDRQSNKQLDKSLNKQSNQQQLAFRVRFEREDAFRKRKTLEDKKSVQQVFDEAAQHWKAFWEKGGVVDLHRSRDARAMELERRIVLSQYLLAIQSAGNMPPQETGLTCNSWYGKAHLEMYLWHEAYLPLFQHTELLERSLSWYLEHLPQAKENAARNGYRGARWPKMVAESGIDCPSPIATLLIWQQPHIIYMLELAYQDGKDRAFLEKYYMVVKESADFMADLAVYNEEKAVYELLAPVIPVQENHAPMDTKNPAFELEYWNLGLRLAAKWAERLQKEEDSKEWKKIAKQMAPMAVGDGCYLAHENCPETYTTFAKDHPSMLCAYGLIDSGRIQRNIMKNSLKKVVENWDYPSLWGWDFAVMAMTAVRLGEPEYAIELLLMDTFKNRYVESGNNFQEGRPDLPLYLPGNGSLLLAIALMTAGYPESGPLVGFPKNGQWEVEFENIHPFPC